MILNLCLNTLFVELVLLKVARVSQTGCVEDANLGKMLFILTTFMNAYTYRYTILARKLVKPGRVGLALFVGTTLLVGIVENVEGVVINDVASKDIGDEFQD